ncbi:hypothetical protein [Clostridium sp.]|uniref:phosphoribosyltransferase-like protein n=1 Tax=Clostridium sp. TaxID=1506 RepID=UPI002851632B|nr:hypothetical protein [Clostridium sp.]MDR3596504.1 hypothetical protein [Clostridium sp.]
MSKLFNNFIDKNEKRIHLISDRLKDFEIDAQKIGIIKAKSRVIGWLKNFDEVGFKDLELPLHLIENIEFLSFDDITDKTIKEASHLISLDSSFIASLGEPNESSFKITSKLHKHKHYFPSLTELLDKLPNYNKTNILLFDDFLNSGGQLVAIFYALLNKTLPDGEINDEINSRTKLNPSQIRKLKKSEIHLFYYLTFDEGIIKVENRLKRELGLNINIHKHYTTNKNDSVFGDKDEQEKIEESASGKLNNRSIYHGKNYSELTEFYKILKSIGELLLRAKEGNWEEHKYFSRALGYGNLCRIIMSDSNVPSITLTSLWQNGKIFFNNKIIDWKELIPRTKKILPKTKFYSKPEDKLDEPCYDSIAYELQTLYENDDFREGLNKAEVYYDKYGAQPKILKHVLRYNMRDKNWVRITEIIEGLDDTELDDEQKAICRFVLFESSLRETHEYRNDRTKFSLAVKNIRQHLNHVPASQKNSSHYYYLLGRWHLDMWWANRDTNNLANLTQALSAFNLSININDTWWSQCYKCIVLKRLHGNNIEEEIEKFRKRIFGYQQEKPNQPSVIIFCITSLILSDNKSELLVFLQNFNKNISPTDFEDSLIHKIEIIYYNNKIKLFEYKKIISRWIELLPRK